MTSQELRQLFLNYFRKEKHLIVPTSSLIPHHDDKSLLFVNAGMVPFKGMFAGSIQAPQKNIASIQWCLRAGGKHNDLDNVGYTARHHTFFEMLGNFSFSGYFKKEAIQFAFLFLTQVLNLPQQKLWITVYKDDAESADIWLNNIGFNPERMSYLEKIDNFWMMGETGPCGPCTEIFYDHGPSVKGGPPGSENALGDRYVEIWNLVFMQYNCQPDKQLIKLPRPCVDTGMGLERLSAVMQGVVSNYDTDLFKPLMKAAAQLMPSDSPNEHTLKVIADHIRAIGFLIADGIQPSNEGRGYVLRRIIRRALRHSYQANLKQPCLYKLIPILVSQMKDSYSALAFAERSITDVLYKEEEQFLRTLHQGMHYFEKIVATLNDRTLPAELVFKLYDTYGFPVDLTRELARERDLVWSEAEFKIAMAHQQKRSKSTQSFVSIPWVSNAQSVFKGHTQLDHKSYIVELLNASNQPVKKLMSGEAGCVILSETPFYAESGGQVGDRGELWTVSTNSSVISRFIVLDTQKIHNAYLHRGYVKEGQLVLKQLIYSQVDIKLRKAIKCHHSATHLLHAALKELFGPTVSQKGSLVTSDYLRFDVEYSQSLTQADIRRIEYRVNQAIWDNLAVSTRLMSLEEAKQMGAIALFDEKYAETVRVLSIGDFSTELCGGTHVNFTGEIGFFKIRAAFSIAACVKRIEAVVGEAAFNHISEMDECQHALMSVLGTSSKELVASVKKQQLVLKQQIRHIEALKHHICQNVVNTLPSSREQLGQITLLLKAVPSLLQDQLRYMIDMLKEHLPPISLIVLGCHSKEGLAIGIGVSKQSILRLDARDIVNVLIPIVQGRGGGRSHFAQVHAKLGDASTLDIALQAVRSYVKERAE